MIEDRRLFWLLRCAVAHLEAAGLGPPSWTAAEEATSFGYYAFWQEWDFRVCLQNVDGNYRLRLTCGEHVPRGPHPPVVSSRLSGEALEAWLLTTLRSEQDNLAIALQREACRLALFSRGVRGLAADAPPCEWG